MALTHASPPRTRSHCLVVVVVQGARPCRDPPCSRYFPIRQSISYTPSWYQHTLLPPHLLIRNSQSDSGAKDRCANGGSDERSAPAPLLLVVIPHLVRHVHWYQRRQGSRSREDRVCSGSSSLLLSRARPILSSTPPVIACGSGTCHSLSFGFVELLDDPRAMRVGLGVTADLVAGFRRGVHCGVRWPHGPRDGAGFGDGVVGL